MRRNDYLKLTNKGDELKVGDKVEYFRNRLNGVIKNKTIRINRPVYQVYFPSTGKTDWFYRDDLDVVRTMKEVA